MGKTSDPASKNDKRKFLDDNGYTATIKTTESDKKGFNDLMVLNGLAL